MALTTASAVRTLGGLGPAGSSGAVTDEQLTAAIGLASREMKRIVSKETYAEVQGWITSPPVDPPLTADEIEKRDDFKAAEGYFAISHLPKLTKNSQFASGGLVQRSTIQESVTEFASKDENDKVSNDWVTEAMKCLEPYLSLVEEDEVETDGDGEPQAFVRANKRLAITVV